MLDLVNEYYASWLLQVNHKYSVTKRIGVAQVSLHSLRAE